MAKIDFKNELSHLYKTSAKEVGEVMVPSLTCLMIDDAGDPNTTPSYAEALFSVSYTAKFALKRSTPSHDYAVMPLEGLWWADDLTAFTRSDRTQWQWTMMIMQPSMVTPEVISAAPHKWKTILRQPML